MSETVEDILRDIRSRAEVAGRQDEDATVHHSAVGALLHDIADRFENAYKILPGMWIIPAENAKLRAENERLKEALKPVLECYCWIKRFKNGSIIMDGMENAIDAITEAQRICNGGVK